MGIYRKNTKVYCLQFFMNSDKTTNINIKDKNTKRQFIKGLDFVHKNNVLHFTLNVSMLKFNHWRGILLFKVVNLLHRILLPILKF